jgi:hypothetical protein
MDVRDLKVLLSNEPDDHMVVFEIHTNGQESKSTYSADTTESVHGFFVLISEVTK